MHILFCHKNQKNVLQKEIKDWTFEAYSLTKEVGSWFPLIASLKMTSARSYMWFLKFYQTDGLFFVASFIQIGKIAATYPKSAKGNK